MKVVFEDGSGGFEILSGVGYVRLEIRSGSTTTMLSGSPANLRLLRDGLTRAIVQAEVAAETEASSRSTEAP